MGSESGDSEPERECLLMAAAPGLSLSLKVVVCLHAFTVSLLALAHLSSGESAETYIVHMDSSVMPKPFSTHHAWYSSMLSSISAASKPTGATDPTTSTPPELMYAYSNSINGFSASLTPSQLEALERFPGYLSSAPDEILKPHTTRTSGFLGLRPGSGAWAASNYGDGVIIGMVDSGIWPESASFDDKGMTKPPSRWKGACLADDNFTSSMCNNKIIGARLYNKGFIAKYMESISMNSTRDSDGHGTHTSSTAAGALVKGASYFGYANGTAVGMAPRAWIAVYKVIWNGGIAQSDALAAMDQAIADGVDILSLSFSFGNNSLHVNPISIACFTAMKKGIFVAASAGNDGSFYGTITNGAPWVTTVGAATMDRNLYGVLTLGNGVKIPFPSWYPGKHSPKNKSLVLSDCDSMDEFHKMRGSIAVCKKSDIMDEQQYYARITNATAAIFISEKAELLDSTRTEFPSAYLLVKEGQTVIDYLNKSRDPRASIEFQKTEIGVKPAPVVDVYSSRGPFIIVPNVLKPDIIAPGTSVLAAWPSKTAVDDFYYRWYTDFNVQSGTSMSTPHIAGVAALVKAVRPDWSPAAIRSAMMTTADALDNTQNPIKDTYGDSATALDMGAGQVNPNKALDPGLIYDTTAKDYVQFLCGVGFTAKQIKTITRSSHKCLNASADLNYPSFIAYFNGDPSAPDEVVQVFHRTVTNVGKGPSTYTAKLTTLNGGLKAKVEPKKLVFSSKYEKLSYKLTLEGPKYLTEYVVSGHLSWVSDGGKYVVTTPILATRMNPGEGPDSFRGF